MTDASRIVRAEVVSVALPAVGLRLHSDGQAPPLQVRHVVRLTSHDGLVGVGEASPRISGPHLAELAAGVIGEDPFQLDRIRRLSLSAKFYRMDLAIGAAAIQMACLDLAGRSIGRPISDLLGGRLRDSLPVIGYLYRRVDEPAADEELLSRAANLYREMGFRTWKLKAGAVEVDRDLRTVRALRDAYPEHRIRVDPNGGWDIATALEAGRVLQGCGLEWIEDPVLGLEAMAAFTRRSAIPTATNMCCIEPNQFPAAVRSHAMDVMLLDLWYLGGPWSARQMAAMCQTFGIGIGIHCGGGSPESGIGLAAELHLGSALPSIVHAADTAYFELTGDLIDGAPFTCADGEMRVPSGPGLGVVLDEDSLARAAERFRQHPDLERHREQPFPAYPLY